MPTLRAAAELLASADSIDALTPVAAAIGFSSAPSPLDDDALRALGVHDLIPAARVVASTGALRALLVVAPGGLALRDLLQRVATRLSSSAPHVLWCVIATQPASGDVAVAAWSDDRRPPRVAALVSRRARVVDSDAETICALSAAHGERDLLTHARWIEILSREALTLRFYRALEQSVNAIAESSAVGSRAMRAELALLDTSRLLFLSFLEAKGWLDGDRAFLSHQFERCLASGGGFQRHVLRPLFFGTLNTPVTRRAPVARRFGRVPFLNGGLFSRTPAERAARGVVFSDDAYGRLLFDLFGQYRFTAREESASWSEAAVDPEMLGRAFESLMGGAERRRTGAFFTPFVLVERVTTAGLDAALAGATDRGALEQLTVLDPACGSGAFLVHALERVATLLVAAGDDRGIDAIRRDVLTRSIFGVDVNPTAVWLCELRLWLSVVIESPATDPAAVMPLPNLDRNVRVGDALAGSAFDADSSSSGGSAGMRRLRERYVRASGSRKAALARQLDRAERARALSDLDAELAHAAGRRRDLLLARRGRDLFGGRYHPSRDERETAAQLRRQSASLRTSRRRIANGGALPFSFRVHFADVAARGGFSLALGNPPWIRLHRIDPADRAVFRRNFEAARLAAWEPGATSAHAGRGFAAQVDVAALFTERAIDLLAPHGALALLLPAKLWRSLAGGGIRRIVNRELQLRRLEDYSEASALFDAAVYPSLLVGTRAVDDVLAPADSCVDVAVHHHRAGSLSWTLAHRSLAFDDSAGSPWILLPPEPRRAFDLLRAAGTPLAQSAVGRPYLGVKCGCNDAFIVRLDDVDGALAEVTCVDGRRATIEHAMLRPVIRGEQLRPWAVQPSAEHIIWTHAPNGAVLPSLPPHAARLLGRWRRQLEARADARRCTRWWSLFRTESARCDGPRVVWGDVGRAPRAVVIDAGAAAVPLNSCYVAHCASERDAYALAALLNGPLARAWLDALAEPARGGYRRFLGWTVSLLPVPRDWSRASDGLAPLGVRAALHGGVSDLALLEAAAQAYDVEQADVASLVAWDA